jgi:hypothetical protein
MSIPRLYSIFPALPQRTLELYGCAVQVIAAADGRLTHEERELLFEDARRHGVSADIIEGWSRFNHREETVASILAKLKPHTDLGLSRRIIYQAIRIAFADQTFTIDERAAIDEAALILCVDAREVESLTALVRLEAGVSDLRHSLLLD